MLTGIGLGVAALEVSSLINLYIYLHNTSENLEDNTRYNLEAISSSVKNKLVYVLSKLFM